MSIVSQLRIVNRLEQLANTLRGKYAQQAQTALELDKLQKTLKELELYLKNLDKLKPNFDTNAINHHVMAIKLHVDILKEELAPKDYAQLANGMKALKTVLRFHPVKYSFITYTLAWFLEWLYFI